MLLIKIIIIVCITALTFYLFNKKYRIVGFKLGKEYIINITKDTPTTKIQKYSVPKDYQKSDRYRREEEWYQRSKEYQKPDEYQRPYENRGHIRL